MASRSADDQQPAALNRLHFLVTGLAGAPGATAHGGPASAGATAHARLCAQEAGGRRGNDVPTFALEQETLAELQAGMRQGKLSTVALVERCLARIAEVDAAGAAIHAAIERNSDALAIAAERHRERRAGRIRGAARDSSPHRFQLRYGGPHAHLGPVAQTGVRARHRRRAVRPVPG